MSMLNDKPEMFGIPVTDFYILAFGEVVFLLLAVFKVSALGMIPAAIFFIVFGGTLYAFILFKKFLPEHFFFNLFNFLTGKKLYMPKATLNAEHKILTRIFENTEEK